jgi:F0F1-type ATP synthase assembly protein I
MDQDPMPTGRKPSNSFLKYSNFAFQLFGGMGLAGWLGYKLDHYLGLKFPAFLLTFILTVFVGMIYQVYRNGNKE